MTEINCICDTLPQDTSAKDLSHPSYSDDMRVSVISTYIPKIYHTTYGAKLAYLDNGASILWKILWEISIYHGKGFEMNEEITKACFLKYFPKEAERIIDELENNFQEIFHLVGEFLVKMEWRLKPIWVKMKEYIRSIFARKKTYRLINNHL
jgi:hypothetical protein